MNPGIYDCEVKDAFWSKSSVKGTPCIAIKAQVEDLSVSEVLNGDIYITPATIGTKDKPGMAVSQLRALGYKGTMSALVDPQILIGLRGKCVVEETNRGGSRIARFGVGGKERVAMELSALEAMDKALGGGVGAERNSVDSFDEENPETTGNDSPPTDEDFSAADDIPF